MEGKPPRRQSKRKVMVEKRKQHTQKMKQRKASLRMEEEHPIVEERKEMTENSFLPNSQVFHYYVHQLSR